jgi:hypothetical protein
MGDVRTILAALAALCATHAAALPPSSHERARVFADCAGWLLALEEHQRLFDGAASEVTASRRAAFLDLLDAVLPDATAQGLPDGTALSWRVTARAEQAILLTRAAFAEDPLARPASAAAAEARVAGCLRLLPGT